MAEKPGEVEIKIEEPSGTGKRSRTGSSSGSPAKRSRNRDSSSADSSGTCGPAEGTNAYEVIDLSNNDPEEVFTQEASQDFGVIEILESSDDGESQSEDDEDRD